MTKHEKIIEAYGEHWEKVKNFVDDDGWCNSFWDICEINKGYTKPKSFGTKWRPKSLQGIENNNGWIKIESEADLPKDSTNYWTVTKFDKEPKIRWFNRFFNEYEKDGKVTHYQPIIKPLPPIY